VSQPVRYRIDPGASRLTARAFAGGPLAAMGHNPSFAIPELQGEVEFDPASPASSALRMTAAARSLTLTDNMSDKDRRDIERTAREEVLESGKFADIVYDCPASRVTTAGPMQFSLNGELTLRGVTRTQPVSARVYLTGDVLRGNGEATIRQSEFGIRPVAVAGGVLKVKDEVKVAFDIVARRAPAGPES
jgi:polyisoprenoid-binding protein YceI